jgi:Tol biopolymer transport system component
MGEEVGMARWGGGARGGTRWSLACLGWLLLVACAGPATSGAGVSPSAPASAVASVRLTGTIAFARPSTSDPGRRQLYLQRADGSDVRQLVRSDADDVDPALSPDGRRLAFTRRVAGQPDRIFVVGVDGSGLRQLTPSGCPGVCGDSLGGSSWSPDGRMLAFTRTILEGNPSAPVAVGLWLATVDGGVARKLTQKSARDVAGRLVARDGYASWSPDGERLAFAHVVRGQPGLDQYAVESIRIDGTDRRQVTPNDVQAGEPAWSPDGALIAFQSPPDEEDFSKNLFTIRPDGKGMTPLTANLGTNDSDHPTWSSDGALVAFSHAPDGSASGADLYVVGRDGSRPHPIAVTPVDEGMPSWAVGP